MFFKREEYDTSPKHACTWIKIHACLCKYQTPPCLHIYACAHSRV